MNLSKRAALLAAADQLLKQAESLRIGGGNSMVVTVNRPAVIRSLGEVHRFACNERLLIGWEEAGLLDPHSDPALYETRALAVLRGRRDGVALSEIARTLGVKVEEDAPMKAIEQSSTDDEFLAELDQRRQALIADGMKPTEATLRVFASDREAWARYRSIQQRIGKRLAAQEGVTS